MREEELLINRLKAYKDSRSIRSICRAINACSLAA